MFVKRIVRLLILLTPLGAGSGQAGAGDYGVSGPRTAQPVTGQASTPGR